MVNNSSSNKRIAKNTIALYIRMLFAMVVSLYTSRVVLDYLGESDYGIQNVVGGIVTMFAFLSNTLASASQRYFAFELGRNNIQRLKNIFSLTLLLYLIVSVVIVLLAETVGLWFVNHKMLIPLERLDAANWVFQISIISFCVTILATPYQALIIARERMDVYAIVGILDAILHLLFVIFLQYCVHDVDSLIAYGLVMLAYKCICQAIYVIYARYKFNEANLLFCWNGPLAKEMLSYSFWNIFGAIAQICRSQGINMLISAFFLPGINAARGIAYQVNNALNVFATNFYTAVRPQVTKRYASGDMSSTMSLVFSSSKFTFFLMAFISIPMLVYIKPIMSIWLVSVPDYAVFFTQLVIIIALIDSLSNPLMTLMQATGRVKKYQLITGGLVLLNLPMSWYLLHLGFTAEYTMYVDIFIASVSLISRLYIVKENVEFSIRQYSQSILSRVLIVSLFTYIMSRILFLLNDCFYSELLSTLILYVFSVFISIIIIYFIGLDGTERNLVYNVVKNRLKNKCLVNNNE